LHLEQPEKKYEDSKHLKEEPVKEDQQSNIQC